MERAQSLHLSYKLQPVTNRFGRKMHFLGTSCPPKQSTKSKMMLTWESTDKCILYPSRHGSRFIITFNLFFLSAWKCSSSNCQDWKCACPDAHNYLLWLMLGTCSSKYKFSARKYVKGLSNVHLVKQQSNKVHQKSGCLEKNILWRKSETVERFAH